MVTLAGLDLPGKFPRSWNFKLSKAQEMLPEHNQKKKEKPCKSYNTHMGAEPKVVYVVEH